MGGHTGALAKVQKDTPKFRPATRAAKDLAEEARQMLGDAPQVASAARIFQKGHKGRRLNVSAECVKRKPLPIASGDGDGQVKEDDGAEQIHRGDDDQVVEVCGGAVPRDDDAETGVPPPEPQPSGGSASSADVLGIYIYIYNI